MPGNGAVLRVIQISDTHLQSRPGSRIWGVDVDASLTSVLDHLKARHWPADFVIATGDLVHDDGAAAYQRLQAFLEPLSVPVYCLAGNHDDAALLSDVLAAGWVRWQRQVVAEGWQFILLDSTVPDSVAGHLAERELNFLEHCLSAYPDLHAMVCLHHSPLPIGSYWLDTILLDNGPELFAIVDRYPQVRAIIWGHIHQAFSARRGTMDLLAAPSTCVQFKPDTPMPEADTLTPGYRWFELYQDGTLITGIERIAPSDPEASADEI